MKSKKASGYRVFRKLTEDRLLYVNALIKALRAGKVSAGNLYRLDISRTFASEGVTFTLRRKNWAMHFSDMGMTKAGADRLANIGWGSNTSLSTAESYAKRAADWLEHSRDVALAEQNRKSIRIGQTVSFA